MPPCKNPPWAGGKFSFSSLPFLSDNPTIPKMPVAVQSPERKLTDADFMALGEGPPFHELIGGHLFMSPSPTRKHQSVRLELALQLRRHLDACPGSGELYIAPFDLHLSEQDVLSPDLSYFSEDRRDRLSDRGAEGAPDLAIEVLSTATARRDRHEKRPIYARHGVRELWLVHPELETVEIFDLEKQPDQPIAVLENGTHQSFGSHLLPGLEISLVAQFPG